MSLGAASGKSELIQNIASVVRRSGGCRKSKEVTVSKKLEDFVNVAADWFQGRVCLILIDYVLQTVSKILLTEKYNIFAKCRGGINILVYFSEETN